MDSMLDILLKLVNKMRPYALVGALLLVAVFVFFGSTIQFLSSKNVGCSVCHETRAQVITLQQSAHRSISCMACHKDQNSTAFLTTQFRATQNFFEWLFRSYSEPIVTKVRNENCLDCHDRDIKLTVISKSIKVSHKEFSTYFCTDCHGAIAHDMKTRVRTYPDMDSCSACHNYAEGDVTCEKCHPTSTANEPTSLKGAWSITHGPNWKKSHGMGDPNTCSTCHDKTTCVKCHDTEVPHAEPWSYLHPQAAKQNKEPCYRCHNKQYCTNCHRLEMPHPQGFLRQHEYVVKDRGYDVCWRCHTQDYCIPCHFRAAHPNTPSRKFKLD